MLQAILFDIDGTLVDSNDFHVLAWAEAFKQAGHELRLATIHDQVGQGGDNLIPALWSDASPAQVKQLERAHHDLFQRHYARRVRPFPGARDLLRRCREAGYAVVLASSASAEEVGYNLDHVLDAADLVDAVVSGDEVARSKPAPDVFEVALRKIGVAVDDALVVGDSPFDIEAANAAGLRTIALRSGLFTDEQLAGAMAIYDDPSDVLARFDDSPLSRVSARA
ncbi:MULTISPECIES: HAD family hydrolase [Sphingomonas]|uniref:HAD family hydrolase n=1 Tax=Sphingomonas TaxID=13687 RepID=UPI000DEFB1EA|nr:MULTISPECIES: HAD family hydrolase [Sphingomonas]